MGAAWGNFENLVVPRVPGFALILTVVDPWLDLLFLPGAGLSYINVG